MADPAEQQPTHMLCTQIELIACQSWSEFKLLNNTRFINSVLLMFVGTCVNTLTGYRSCCNTGQALKLNHLTLLVIVLMRMGLTQSQRDLCPLTFHL